MSAKDKYRALLDDAPSAAGPASVKDKYRYLLEPTQWRELTEEEKRKRGLIREAPQPEGPGIGESLLRGAAQGASLGFADEIAGGLESAFSNKTYAQARDESRAAYKAAEESNPVAYGAGGLAGGLATSFVPGLNIAEGASLAATAGKAALAGGIAGLGSSEAKDAGGMVKDAAGGALVGGALGAAAHGAGKLIGRALDAAPEQADKELLREVTNRQWGKPEKAIGLKAEETAKALRELGLDKLNMPAEERNALTKEALSRIGQERIQPIYDSVEHAPVRLGDITAPLEARVADLAKTAGTKERAESLAKYLDTIRRVHVREPSEDMLAGARMMRESGDHAGADALLKWHADNSPVAPSALWREVQAAQEKAFENVDPFNPSAAKKFSGEVANDLRGVLQKHVGEVGGAKKLAELKRANELYSLLRPVEHTTAKAVGRAPYDRGGLRDISEVATKGALRAGALLAGGPVVLANELLAEQGVKLAKDGAKQATQALAKLVRAARAGNASAQAVREALESGVPQSVVRAVTGAAAAVGDE